MTIQEMVTTLLQYSLLLSVYHWHTASYARHKATDELYHHVTDFIDQLVEYYQGNHPRLHIDRTIHIYTVSDTNILHVLHTLSDVVESISIKDKGIRARRDDLIGYIHQTMYLFTLA